MKKKIVSFMLGITMLLTPAMSVPATTITGIVQQNNQINQAAALTEEEALRQSQEAQNQLLETKDAIDALSEQQAAVQAEISESYADIVDLMVVIAASEADIANAQTAISQKQAEIDAMALKIREAETDMEKQYDNMKSRIRFMYETDWGEVWFDIIFGSKDLTTFLNRADYAKQIKEYDRKKLLEYAKKVSEATALKSTMETEKAELEAQIALLEAQKSDLNLRKQELQVGLAALQATNIDFVGQISTARAQAAEIISLINLQDAELQNLIGIDAGSITDADWWQPLDEELYLPGGSSGEAIVAFAEQFIGNPYVWGGNSLTNGIDCSHFVYQVLRHCGVYAEGYVTSLGWREKGQPVSSLAEAKAGDIICYSGHVGIYDGKGGIVEARGSKWGITHNRPADFTTILTIRRFTAE